MLETLALNIRQCRACVENPIGSPLPHEPRPVAVLSDKARIRIIGQAPGTRVHQSGRPFTDPSGARLRDWMGISEDDFYNPDILSITPMGFCFPGLDEKGSDLPPRKECAHLWHQRVNAAMPQVELVLLIGMYAQKHYLGRQTKSTLTETVANWRSYVSEPGNITHLPLPHPSWRNNAWIRKNPWFSSELLPALKIMIQDRISVK